MTSIQKLSKNLPEPTRNDKKKRTALENISNANNGLNKENRDNIKQEVLKKSRYVSTVSNEFGQYRKVIGNSKENLNVVSKNKLVSKSALANFKKAVPKTDKVELKSESIETKLATTQISPQPLDYENIDIEADEFNCTDYAEAIFEYYRKRDKEFIIDDYIKEQPHINKQMRLLLVDWMVEVQQQLEFNHEILYLSVKLLDLYLNSKRIEKEKLQLLGGAAMLVACKFEERMAPPLDDFIYVSDNAYDRNELVKMEIDILRTLKYDIGVPLSYTFLRRYAKCVKADMKFLTLARFILELSLQDYKFAAVSDSLKACAALYLALKMAKRHENQTKNNGNCMIINTENLSNTEWNSTLCHYTATTLSDFIEYIPALNDLVKNANGSKYKTILKKYCHPVFYEVAKVPCLSESDIETYQFKCANEINPSFRRI
jgi:hypothetical protein